MTMYQCQLYVFFFLLLTVININSLKLLKEQKSNDIHLEAPHLADRSHSNRPRIKPWANLTRTKAKSKNVSSNDSINPCNGTYTKTNGTTCGLKEIMIGRCFEFEYIKRGFFLTNQSVVKNCTALYESFEDAVRYKSYCNMNMSTYQQYFDLALAGAHVINRAMFWSGTYAVAHAYSANGLNYITLEDTLAAAMVNGLVWCGKENDTDGYDFVSCPNNCKDNKWADVAFWGLASQTFAQLAAGEIYVVLNGSQAGGRSAFRNNSYFSEFELPHFRRNGTFRVTKINALVLHSPDQTVIEKCGEKSLLLLEELIQSKGFDYACKDDPDELILIMCGDQWDARECQIARRVLRQAWDTKLYGTSDTSQKSLSLIIFFCHFLIILFLSGLIEIQF